METSNTMTNHKLESNMTKYPVVVDKEMGVSSALGLMKEFGIRHLPITDEGKIIGVVSERDLLRAKGYQNEDISCLEDVMIPDPYIADRSTPLAKIVYKMAVEKYGCTVITNSDYSVVGIFTTTDALHLLAKLLEEESEEEETTKHMMFLRQFAEWDDTMGE